MIDLLTRAMTAFNQRSEKERFLLTSTVVFLIFIIWLYCFMMPLFRQVQLTSTKLDAAERIVTILTADYDNYESIISSPTTVFENKIQQLDAKLNQLEYHSALTKKVVNTPEAMQDLLKDLSRTGLLVSLNQIQVLEATPISTVQSSLLFNQKITIEFHASYFATRDYLAYLQQLPWYVSFDSVVYQVAQYPNAKVTITLHVLSTMAGSHHA